MADTSVMTCTYNLYFCPRSSSGTNMDTIDAIIADQCQYTEDCIKTVITGLGHQDPFTTIPSHPELTGCSSPNHKSIAQLIIEGTLLTPDGVEVFSPVTKVVTDSAQTRCYLISHKEEAGTLLTYTTLLATQLPIWLNNNSVPIRTITTEVDRLIMARAQAKTSASSLQQSHQDTRSQFEQRVQASLESLEAKVTTQNQRIRELTEQLHSHGIDVTTVKSAVGSMQSSLTTPTVEWRETIQEIGKQCVDRMIEHLDGHMSVMHKLNNDVEEAHINTSAILSDLVDRYDDATTDVYDSNVAYGNELAMLRLMIETCTDRINWLIEDWGFRSTKPDTTTTKFRPEGVAHLHGEIYEHYFSGRDFRTIGTEVREDNERARQETFEKVRSQPAVGLEQNPDPVEGRPPPSASDSTPSQGRPTFSKLHDAPLPPPTPPGPLRPTKAPPLPDSHSPDSAAPTDTASHFVPRANDAEQEVGALARSPTSSLHPLTFAPPTDSGDSPTPLFDTQEGELASQSSASVGTCFCCNRKTFTPQECEICQMMFHTECIIFLPKRGLTMCRQCQSDQGLSMDISSSDSTADLTTQASNTTDRDTTTAANPAEVKMPDGTNSESSSSCDLSSSSSGESSDVSSYSAPQLRPRRTRSNLNPPSTSTSTTRTSAAPSHPTRKSIQTTLKPIRGKSNASLSTRTRSYTNPTIASDLKAKIK